MHRSSDHLEALQKAVIAFSGQQHIVIGWGHLLRERFAAGSKVLVAGNGGSAAQAQHLTAELLGRYCFDRDPFPAIALHADTSTLTAISNDFGAEQLFARQVRAYGLPGDVLIALSTSGRSANVLQGVSAARALGVKTLAMTGPGPNPLLELADDGLPVFADEVATIQEVHLIAIHLMCAALDEALGVVL